MNAPRVERKRAYRWLRLAMKRFMYPQMSVMNAGLEVVGLTDPLMHFVVNASPPSLYLNFVLSAGDVERLSADIRPPYPIVPIRTLADDDPVYTVTINLYCVSGLVNGLRAEWSTFIRDPQGTTRFLVIEAQASGLSLDSVNLFTAADEIRHSLKDNELLSKAKTSDGGWLQSTCILDRSDSRPASMAQEWVAANDYIYWLDGVCDRVYFGSSLAFPDARVLGPDQVHLEDTTRWAPYLKGRLCNAIVFDTAVPMVVSPWKNLHF